MLALLGVALAADLTLKLEAGSELDTNVYRTTSEASSGVTAAGGRAAARLAASVRPASRALLRVGALAAAKFFPEANSANIGVVAADVRLDVAVGRLAPGLRLGYYDAEEAGDAAGGGGLDQDFRTGHAAASLTLRTEDDHRLEATAGGRFFVYKPNGDLDFTGAQLGLSLGRRVRLGDGKDELAYGLGYTLSQRAFAGNALANLCADDVPIAPSCLYLTSRARADLFHDAAVELTFTRAFIVGVRYALQLNDSNSFGQSLVRHRVELSGTAGLFWDLYLNAKVVLIVNRFLDALLLSGDVGTFTTIEDEARNAVILHLTRDIDARLTVEARYAFYANPLSSRELAYRRQTMYVGLVVRFGD